MSRFVRASSERGQAAVLLVGILCAVLIGAAVLGLLATGVGAQGRQQRAADLGALAAARTMHELYPRLFEPALIDRVPNPRHLERAAYLAAARGGGRRSRGRTAPRPPPWTSLRRTRSPRCSSASPSARRSP
jgi:hypothetical protein